MSERPPYREVPSTFYEAVDVHSCMGCPALDNEQWDRPRCLIAKRDIDRSHDLADSDPPGFCPGRGGGYASISYGVKFVPHRGKWPNTPCGECESCRGLAEHADG